MKRHPCAWSDQMNNAASFYLREHFEYLKTGHLRRIKGRVVGHTIKGGHHRSGYLIFGINGRSINYHVAIWLYHHDFRPQSIDHINGIKHDNRIENLRAASSAQNGWNQPKQKRNTSGHKGLFWSKQDNLWYGAVQANGLRKKIGWSKDKKYTLKKLIEYRMKAHGEYFK